MTSSTALSPGSRASMRSWAAADSGWFVRLESEVRPEPSSVPVKPSDTSTTTPHTARTRPGRRVANSASRCGPSLEPRPEGSGVLDAERFDEKNDISGSLQAREAEGRRSGPALLRSEEHT